MWLWINNTLSKITRGRCFDRRGHDLVGEQSVADDFQVTERCLRDSQRSSRSMGIMNLVLDVVLGTGNYYRERERENHWSYASHNNILDLWSDSTRGRIFGASNRFHSFPCPNLWCFQYSNSFLCSILWYFQSFHSFPCPNLKSSSFPVSSTCIKLKLFFLCFEASFTFSLYCFNATFTFSVNISFFISKQVSSFLLWR